MNLRRAFASPVLLTLGLVGTIAAGCLSEEEAMMDIESAGEAVSALRFEGEAQSWSTSSGDGGDASSSTVRLQANASGDYV